MINKSKKKMKSKSIHMGKTQELKRKNNKITIKDRGIHKCNSKKIMGKKNNKRKWVMMSRSSMMKMAMRFLRRLSKLI